MKLNESERALFDILIKLKDVITWREITAQTKFCTRTLRKAKETMLKKGIPIGSVNGEQKYENGASLDGGIFLIRTDAQRVQAKLLYHEQAMRELQHEAQIDKAFYSFWNANLFEKEDVI